MLIYGRYTNWSVKNVQFFNFRTIESYVMRVNLALFSMRGGRGTHYLIALIRIRFNIFIKILIYQILCFSPVIRIHHNDNWPPILDLIITVFGLIFRFFMQPEADWLILKIELLLLKLYTHIFILCYITLSLYSLIYRHKFQ